LTVRLNAEQFGQSTASLIDLLAVRTLAKNFEYMRPDVIAIFAGYRLFQFFDQAHIQMDAAAAVIANYVVMMLSWFDELVATLSISQIDSLN
jgi:hypothetical protein